jgi:hypothetical protein
VNRATVGAIAALGCAAATGCGSGGEDVDADAIRDAVETTERRGPMRVAFRGSVERPSDDGPLEFTGTGHDHPAQRSSDFRTAAGAFAEELPAFDASDLDSRIVKLGPVYYVSSALVAQIAGRGKLLELDVREIGQSSGEDAAVLAQTNQSSPGQVFEYARAAKATEEAGSETVGGVETTRYSGSVPLDEVAERVPAEERKAVADNARRIRDGVAEDTIPIEVWVDEAKLIRKIRLTYEFERGPASGEEFDARFVLQTELSEHGKPVRIERPKGDVVTLEELAAAAE